MKKLSLSLAAMLLSFLAFSQEADDLGRYAEVEFISRFDFNPYFTPGQTGDGSSGHTFGNSSVYTHAEGQLSEHFSFLLVNHWVTTDNTAWKSLYQSTFHSDASTWVDYANVTLTFGNWNFTLGKDAISTAGFEYENWDWDVHYDQASWLWLNMPAYQWGGKVAYTNNAENTTLSVQMVSSPFGERPFASGLFAYSGQWRGNYGWFSNIWSISAIETEKGTYSWLAALGQQAELGNLTIGFNWFNTEGIDYDELTMARGNTFRPTIEYAPLDWFDCSAKCNLYTSNAFDAWNGGIALNFHPLSDREAVQLHAVAGYDSLASMVSFTIGMKCNLSLIPFFGKK